MPNKDVKALLCALFCFIALNAQEEFIKGQLLDSKTGEPGPFATIRIKGYALGVVSNMDGSFKVPQKFQNYGDLIEISCMGYRKKGVLISGLYRKGLNTISLVPRIFELKEAIVTAEKKRTLSARGIIRRALRAIPKNFPVTSFSTVGYYRDYQLKDSQYINLNEAILEVFDRGFDFSDINNKVLMYDYQQNLDFTVDTLGSQAYNYRTGRKIIDKDVFLGDYGGNEFVILRIHDAIRNYRTSSFSFVDRMRYDFLLNHHGYRKGAVTYLNDQTFYTIHFKKHTRNHDVKGTFYIAKNNFAIHKMEYSVYDNLGDRSRDEGKRGALIFRIVTEYQRKNSKMYLNYISFNNRFEIRRPPALYMKEIGVNPLQKTFVLRFSEEVAEMGVFNKENYEFTYKGKPVEIDRIVLYGKEVWAYPKMASEQDLKTFEEIYMFSKRQGKIEKYLKFNVRNLQSIKGDMLNERKLESYNQFREFFVQQIRPGSLPVNTTNFMDKERPIFENQPMAPPANFEDYWMNTPLQKMEE